MRFPSWFVCFLAAAVLSLSMDVITKSAPHSVLVRHYSHIPVLMVIVIGGVLWLIAFRRSNLLAVGCGLMFGGLCANGGQTLLYGYASDWLRMGDWLTNAADLSGGLGLVLCCVGLALPGSRGATRPST